MKDKIKDFFGAIGFQGVFFLVALIIVIIVNILPVCFHNTYTATVTDKSVKRYNGSDKYLIYTDIGTFENTDQWLCGKFNSSDIYGRIEVGATYEFDTIGIRVTFFSWYENIIAVRGVDNE